MVSERLRPRRWEERTSSVPLSVCPYKSVVSAHARVGSLDFQHILRNVGSPGSPVSRAWTNTEILGKSISQTDAQAQLFYKGS